ncbi:MAG: DegT/DnrJ/EryC1/StrS family aminotransferase [Bacteroidota bacterium]
MKIQMVDTITQYQKIQQEVDNAVLEVVRSGRFINGPVVQSFRDHLADYLDVPHALSCANGTDALQIALMALDLQAGDEVITASFTYVATVEVIALLRLKPVFVEVDPDTFNLNIEAVEAAISDKTRAILPVHLFGQAADMGPIMDLAAKHELYVVEDTAQAIGSDYTFPDGNKMKTGTIGHIGTTSFYPSKNLGAYGDGGAIFTRDAKLAEILWSICNHGSERRYYHDRVGVNSRLDAIQAAILDVKLKHLDAYTEARRKAAALYDEMLGEVEGVEIPFRADYAQHVFHQYTLKIAGGRAKRDDLKAKLDAAGIPNMIYYPVPLHLQKAYNGYGYKEGDFPISEQLSEQVLSLPMHSELDETQQSYIVEHLKKFI